MGEQALLASVGPPLRKRSIIQEGSTRVVRGNGNECAHRGSIGNLVEDLLEDVQRHVVSVGGSESAVAWFCKNVQKWSGTVVEPDNRVRAGSLR